jgi:hypothetical protein
MTYFIATIKAFFYKRPEAGLDPVYEFFFKTSAGDRKKIYKRALDKAQEEQELISKIAKEKVRI